MPDRRVPVTVEAIAHAPLELAFDVILPIDLPSVFHRVGPLPGVAAVRDQTGDWDAPGQTRTIVLGDGSTARERLTEVDRPDGFAYVVGPFSGPLRWLVDDAEGRWELWGDEADGTTSIRWTYAFRPRGAAEPLVRRVVAPLWRRYARRALARAVTAVEAKARATRSAGPAAS